MVEGGYIKDNLWKQECEDVKVSEIDGGGHIVEIDKHEFKGDKHEVEKDDDLNLIQDYDNAKKSETEHFIFSETKHAADFRTENFADTETEDSANSEEAEMEIDINPDDIGFQKREEIKKEADLESEEFHVFVCNYCGHDFAQKGNLRRHEKKFHPKEVKCESLQLEVKEVKIEAKEVKKELKKFRGAVDSKPYRTESKSGKPKCIKCGNEFARALNLKIHVRKIHMGIGLTSCTECGKKLSSAQKLTQHVRNVHSETTRKKRYKGHPDWKPYRSESELGKPKCKTCGKEYSCATHLKIHVRSVHILKGLKPTNASCKIPVAKMAERTCLVCEKIFLKKSEMIKHLVRHTRIYKNLDVERQTVRSEDGTSVTCLECGKGDKRASNIKAHIAQVHFKLCDIIDFDNMESYELSDNEKKLHAHTGQRTRQGLEK